MTLIWISGNFYHFRPICQIGSEYKGYFVRDNFGQLSDNIVNLSGKFEFGSEQKRITWFQAWSDLKKVLRHFKTGLGKRGILEISLKIKLEWKWYNTHCDKLHYLLRKEQKQEKNLEIKGITT